MENEKKINPQKDGVSASPRQTVVSSRNLLRELLEDTFDCDLNLLHSYNRVKEDYTIYPMGFTISPAPIKHSNYELLIYWHLLPIKEFILNHQSFGVIVEFDLSKRIHYHGFIISDVKSHLRDILFLNMLKDKYTGMKYDIRNLNVYEKIFSKKKPLRAQVMVELELRSSDAWDFYIKKDMDKTGKIIGFSPFIDKNSYLRIEENILKNYIIS